MSTPSPALSSPPAPPQTPGIFARIGSALQKAAPYIQPIADHLAAAFGNYAPLENDQQQQALQANQAQSQRQSLMGTYRTIFSDARPEVQPEIAQRMLTIGTTPLRAPLPSSVSDLSSITAPAQQDLQARADQSQQAGVGNQDAYGKSFRPTPAPPMTLPPTPGFPAAPQLTSNIPGVTNPNALTGDKMPQPATPRVSLFPSHEEQTQEAAQRAQALARATLSGQIGARDAYLEANPDADPQTAALALGHQMPVGLLRTQNTSTNVRGSEIPSLKTQDGQPIDPNKFYNIVRQGTDSFAVPSGLSANVAQSNIDKNTAAQGELAARTNLEKGRAGMIPLQTQKLIQDMQLAPQKVAMAAANSAGRWFGPTGASRQTSQYASDVEDKIDAVQPLIASLAQSGKLGPIAGRWQDFLAGKIHSGDPGIANLKAQMDILGKAVMKMHGFRNAEQANAFIAQNLNVGTTPEQLVGSLEGLRTAARTYETMGSLPPEIQDQMMRAFTGGKNVTPRGTEHVSPSNAPPTFPKIPPRNADEYLRSIQQ